MNQLTNEQIMDYLDGALSESETARIETHLKNNPADAEIVGDLKMALGHVKTWHESEPLQVSENFWPKLRDNLGPAPKRGLLSSIQKSLGDVFGTSRAARFSVGVALATIVLAMGAFMFAPQNATQPVIADKISAGDQAFIQQSMQKHEAFVQSAPVAGDVSSLETGAEDDNEPEIP
ncbi:MAG TPA: zf-HC2 domain-containing protein [Abditibacterium sp.]|jgi:anti-sigma factor RsiW